MPPVRDIGFDLVSYHYLIQLRALIDVNLALFTKAVAENWRSYVLVNNRSEGNAPLTVQALTEMLSKE